MMRILHDTARSLTMKKIQKKLQEVGCVLVPYPPYSPDLTLSEYHLFRSLKNSLKNIEFGNADDFFPEIVFFIDA